jgi:hypothetical protein
MPSDRSSLVALRNLIAEIDLILETTPDLPQNRTACCRENLRAALALTEDLIKQQRMTPAAVLGSKGGRRHGCDARARLLPAACREAEDQGRRQTAQTNRVSPTSNHESLEWVSENEKPGTMAGASRCGR